MKFLHSTVLLMAAVALGLTACGQRDREEANKTSDGSDTFVYVKPDLKKYAKKSSVEETPASSSAGAKEKSTGKDRSVTPTSDVEKK